MGYIASYYLLHVGSSTAVRVLGVDLVDLDL